MLLLATVIKNLIDHLGLLAKDAVYNKTFKVFFNFTLMDCWKKHD